METRIAVVGIIVESSDSVEKLNNILHDYGQYIIGRMGLPYQKRNISIISIVMDAPNDVISALSGKLGMLPNVSSKTVYQRIGDTPAEAKVMSIEQECPQNKPLSKIPTEMKGTD